MIFSVYVSVGMVVLLHLSIWEELWIKHFKNIRLLYVYITTAGNKKYNSI